MEAVSFIKAWKRYIKEEGYKQCLDCKNRDTSTINICCDSIKTITNCMIKNIELVEEWAKTHPEFVLTDQQKAAVRGRIAEGARWIFVDGVTKGKVCFSDIKPTKKNNYVTSFDGRHPKYLGVCDDMLYKFVTWENSPIYLEKLLENKEE